MVTPQALLIRSIGFNIPCRQFSVDAQVARDRWLPIVDEFVLRALHSCERLSSKKLALFFGFNTYEIDAVLTDLQSRSLISAEGEYISIHNSARDMFRTGEDEAPTLVQVESFPSRIWFDLISRAMVPAGPKFAGRNLVDLPPDTAAKVDVEFAREAFQASFRDYIRRVRRVSNAEQWNLYAITHVEPGRFGFAQFEMQEELTLNPSPKLVFNLKDEGDEAPTRLRRLTAAATSAVKDLTDAEPSAAARAEFGRLIQSELLARCTLKDGHVDLAEWLRLSSADNRDDLYYFVGSPLVERNRAAITRLFGHRATIAKGPSVPGIVWIRPGGSLWGRSQELHATLAELRTLCRSASEEKGRVVATLAAPSASSKEMVRRFDRLFERGVYLPAGVISPAMEVIFVKGIGAVVGVVVSLAADIRICLGCATSRESTLNRIESVISQLEIDKARPIWKRTRDKIEDTEDPISAAVEN